VTYTDVVPAGIDLLALKLIQAALGPPGTDASCGLLHDTVPPTKEVVVPTHTRAEQLPDTVLK